MISVLDLFSIGIGPSSSHTMGPMRAAREFVSQLSDIQEVRVELYGSLALTGEGHGTDKAILLGLEGHTPEGIDPEKVEGYLERIEREGTIQILGRTEVPYSAATLEFKKDQFLPYHSNAMKFISGEREEVYYSIGGGFIQSHAQAMNHKEAKGREVPYPFESAKELLAYNLPIEEVMLENEKAWRSAEGLKEDLRHIWNVMQASVVRGCQKVGELPGGLGVERRAPQIYQSLLERNQKCYEDPALIMDWTSLFALAVNEENAAGGRIVTTPTNGAAGVIPAVLHYYRNFIPTFSEGKVIQFLLVAGAFCILYKKNASISAAEVGCQGEVGVASSIAAAGLASVLGGTNLQIENAAEIAMEHHLGLTCDPVGGLVQIPCIERNAMGAIKAINAARLALFHKGNNRVTLDEVIAAMYDTGRDMKSHYKETSLGGLAKHVNSQIPVSIPEC